MQLTSRKASSAVDRFRKVTPGSAKLFEKAKMVSPGGVMAGIKHFEPYPIYMKKASGSRIWDVDGNEYVDCLMSYGALVLGHGIKMVKDAIDRTLREFGTSVTGTPTPLEFEYGRVLLDMYQKDGLVRFTNSGLEATMLAVRLARANTGRRMVGKFEGHYHGAVEGLLVSYKPGWRKGRNGPPKPWSESAEVSHETLSESLVLPFNDWETTEKLISDHAEELSCVILEPFEEGVIPGRHDFMANLRRLTADLGIPLIFDEVKTGFRVRLGGAAEYYGLTPDLTCLGKIAGGGLPMGVVLGRSDLMKQLDPLARKRVFHSGTFNGNPLCVSAGMATLSRLKQKGAFAKLTSRTESLRRAFSKHLSDMGIDHVMKGEGGMFNFYLTDEDVENYADVVRSDLASRRVFDLGLLTRGVYIKPESRFCLSLAHSGEDVRLVSERFRQVISAIG